MDKFGTERAAADAGFVDVNLVCVRCGVVFTWLAGEQFFYQEKDLRAPRRCKPCKTRERRTAAPRYPRDGA